MPERLASAAILTHLETAKRDRVHACLSALVPNVRILAIGVRIGPPGHPHSVLVADLATERNLVAVRGVLDHPEVQVAKADLVPDKVYYVSSGR